MTFDNQPPQPTDERLWIGAELNPAGIRAGVFDSGGSLLGKAKVSTKLERGADRVIGRVARCIRYAVDECDLALDAISGIGVAVPGRIDVAGGVVHSMDLGWEKVALVDQLAAELGLPVHLAQCFEAGARGVLESEFARSEARRIGVIFPGPKVGAAVVVDGKFRSLETAATSDEDRALAGGNWIASMPHPVFGGFRGRDFRKALKRQSAGLVQAYAIELAGISGAAAARLWRVFDLETIVLAGSLMDEMTEEIVAAARSGFVAARGDGKSPEPEWRVSALGDLAMLTGAATVARESSAVRGSAG